MKTWTLSNVIGREQFILTQTKDYECTLKGVFSSVEKLKDALLAIDPRLVEMFESERETTPPAEDHLFFETEICFYEVIRVALDKLLSDDEEVVLYAE